jgi:hypothetical protein
MTKYVTVAQLEATNENLAEIINKGFTDSRIHIEEKLESLRADIRADIDRIDQRLRSVSYRVELVDLEQRVSRIEGEIGSTPSAT